MPIMIYRKKITQMLLFLVQFFSQVSAERKRLIWSLFVLLSATCSDSLSGTTVVEQCPLEHQTTKRGIYRTKSSGNKTQINFQKKTNMPSCNSFADGNFH